MEKQEPNNNSGGDPADLEKNVFTLSGQEVDISYSIPCKLQVLVVSYTLNVSKMLIKIHNFRSENLIFKNRKFMFNKMDLCEMTLSEYSKLRDLVNEKYLRQMKLDQLPKIDKKGFLDRGN